MSVIIKGNIAKTVRKLAAEQKRVWVPASMRDAKDTIGREVEYVVRGDDLTGLKNVLNRLAKEAKNHDTKEFSNAFRYEFNSIVYYFRHKVNSLSQENEKLLERFLTIFRNQTEKFCIDDLLNIRKLYEKYIEQGGKKESVLKKFHKFIDEKTSTKAPANKKSSCLDFRLKEEQQELVENNRGLVPFVIDRFFHNVSEEKYEDAVQHGMFGLMVAVKKYKPEIGEFSTMAVHWIRSYVGKFLSRENLVKAPYNYNSLYKKIKRLQAGLETKLDRPPTDKELAKAAGISVDVLENVKLACATRKCKSLSERIQDSTLTYADVLPSSCVNPKTLAEKEELRSKIDEVLNNVLTERERSTVTMLYGLDGNGHRTLKEIGIFLGITKERARQISRHAIKKIRKDEAAMSALQKYME